VNTIIEGIAVPTAALAEAEAVADELEALLSTVLPLLDRAVVICDRIENVERAPWTDDHLENFWQVTSLQRVHDAYYAIAAATETALG
jgi:hypothetical protein